MAKSELQENKKIYSFEDTLYFMEALEEAAKARRITRVRLIRDALDTFAPEIRQKAREKQEAAARALAK